MVGGFIVLMFWIRNPENYLTVQANDVETVDRKIHIVNDEHKIEILVDKKDYNKYQILIDKKTKVTGLYWYTSHLNQIKNKEKFVKTKIFKSKDGSLKGVEILIEDNKHKKDFEVSY